MKFKVTAMTMHDGEVSELAALGLNIETKNGRQTNTEFVVELTDEQAKLLQEHSAVTSVTPV
ncbi:MAG: hypothetical protein SFV17_06125 [Candidatus Obscuribacter sp.]|nr:hypothetical protein [Candidatus Obscuribacter sp.]